MVRASVALPAVLGLVLLAAFFAAPAADPPDEYVVVAEQNRSATAPTAYGDLAAGDRAAFDAALANDGSVRYVGQTYPDGVEFPGGDRTSVTEQRVEYESTAYDLRFVYEPTFPDSAGVLRTLGSLVGGVLALAYAGYRAATA
jgi:hypothetical protein